MTRMPLRLVLLPGLNGDGELFAPLCEALLPWLQVSVITLPSQGAQDHASLAQALRPQLSGLDGPWVLLGESFSGALAHRLCRELDKPPLGLILASSFLQRPRRLLPPARLLAALRGAMSLTWPIKHFCLGHGASPELTARVAGQIRRLPAHLLAARIEALAHLQPPEAVLSLPTLQLVARRDRLVGAAASSATARYCSDLQRIDLDGPHFLLQREPQACAEAIAAFCERLTSPALP